MKSKLTLVAFVFTLAFGGAVVSSCNETVVEEVITNVDGGLSSLGVSAGVKYTTECEPTCPDNSTECRKERGMVNYPGVGPVRAYYCSCEGCKLLLKQGVSVEEIDPEDFYGDTDYPKFVDEFEQVADDLEGEGNYEVQEVGFEVFYNGDGTETYVVEYSYTDDENNEKNIIIRVGKTSAGGFEPTITAFWCEPPCETSCNIAYCCSLDFFCTCENCTLKSTDIRIPLY